MSSEPQKVDEHPKITVACDFCGVPAEMPKVDWSTRCKNEKCLGDGALILAPLKENTRYIRMACKGTVRYAMASTSATIYTCSCTREHIIVESVGELRNNQLIYTTKEKSTLHEELTAVTEKLKKSEDEVQELKKQVNDLQEENDNNKMEKQKMAEEENKKNSEELVRLRKKLQNKKMKKTGKFRKERIFASKIGSQPEKKLQRVLKELEKIKNEKAHQDMKISFLEKSLDEKKEELKEKKEEVKDSREEIKVLRQIVLKRECSINDEEPPRKRQNLSSGDAI